MSASIRGHQTRFEIYENGDRKSFDSITSFSVNQDSSFMKSFYVGNAIPEGDQSIEGWSGSLDVEVKSAAEDEFIDALVTKNLNGIGVSKYYLIDTELYSDGTQRTYVYMDVQFKISKSSSGSNAKITKKLDFQAMSRKKL